eukprot:g25912.t1
MAYVAQHPQLLVSGGCQPRVLSPPGNYAPQPVLLDDMPPPEVSIILPVYNAEAFLDEALESILQQSFLQKGGLLEVSAFDDGSSDGSAAVLQRWAERLTAAFPESGVGATQSGPTEPPPQSGPLQLVCSGDGSRSLAAEESQWRWLLRELQAALEGERYEGIVRCTQSKDEGSRRFACNSAIRQSRGTFLCRFDADDVMHPERVERQVEALRAQPPELRERTILGTGFTVSTASRGARPEEEQLMSQRFREVTLLHPTWMYHRRVWETVGGYTHDTTVGDAWQTRNGRDVPCQEDIVFFHQHLEKGGRLLRLREPLLHYRCHPGQRSWRLPRREVQSAKAAAFERQVLSTQPWREGFGVVGAGRDARDFCKALSPEALRKVRAFYEVDPKKIGKSIAFPFADGTHQVPVLEQPKLQIPFVVCVALERGYQVLSAIARDQPTAQEGVDYFHLEEALRLLQAGAKHFAQLPTLVPITVSKGASLHVVGDLHGQFCELMTVISLCGLPSQSNMFLFNGDFVDRGGRSVEVMMALVSMALAAPGRVFLTPGEWRATALQLGQRVKLLCPVPCMLHPVDSEPSVGFGSPGSVWWNRLTYTLANKMMIEKAILGFGAPLCREFGFQSCSVREERDKTKHWAPPAEVVAFFEKHPAPLYVGFGSMINDRPKEIGQTLYWWKAGGEKADGWEDLIIPHLADQFMWMRLVAKANQGPMGECDEKWIVCRSRAVGLKDVATIDRFAPTLGEVAQDLLWSDPINEDGRHLSQRGAGILFGPDVTEEFFPRTVPRYTWRTPRGQDNDLLCCIRSHEVKHRGYEWQRGGRCLTIFSAANYIGRMGNLGAVCHIAPAAERIEAADLSISTFQGAAPQQPVTFQHRRSASSPISPNKPQLRPHSVAVPAAAGTGQLRSATGQKAIDTISELLKDRRVPNPTPDGRSGNGDRNVLKRAVVQCFKRVEEDDDCVDCDGLTQVCEALSKVLELPMVAFGDLQNNFLCFDFDGSGMLEVNEVYKVVKHQLRQYRKQLGGETHQVNMPFRTLQQAGYTVYKELGRGSQGVAKLAKDPTGREFCVKCLKKDSMSISGIEELQEEFQTLQLLAHDNIAHVTELFQDSQFYYMAPLQQP